MTGYGKRMTGDGIRGVEYDNLCNLINGIIIKTEIVGNFKKLRVWKDAVDLAVRIYQITSKEPFSKDYGLSNQIQRAAVSVASNIAEGDDRDSNKEAARFFKIAKGSAAEVITQLNIAYKIGYINEEVFNRTEDFTEKIKASLNKLIKARREMG